MMLTNFIFGFAAVLVILALIGVIVFIVRGHADKHPDDMPDDAEAEELYEYCWNCGYKNETNTLVKKCPYCGNKLDIIYPALEEEDE